MQRLRKRWLQWALLLTMPVALFFVVAARWSWRPRSFTVSGSVINMAFAPDGHSLALYRFGGKSAPGKPAGLGPGTSPLYMQIELWDVQGRTPQRWLAHGDSNPLQTIVEPGHYLAYMPDGRALVYSREDGSVKLLNIPGGQVQPLVGISANESMDFGVAPAGQLWVQQQGGEFHFYDARTGRPLVGGSIVALPQQRFTTSFATGGKLVVYNEPAHRLLWSLGGFAGFSNAPRLSPNGKMLAAANARTLVICDLSVRRITARVPLGHMKVGGMVWSPDGKLLALLQYSSPDLGRGQLNLRSTADGKLLLSLDKPLGKGSLAFSPDSRIFAYAVDSGLRTTITLQRVR